MERVTIKLNATHSYLDINDGEVFDEITIHEPSVADMVEVSELTDDDYRTGVFVLAKICHVEPFVIENLSVSEYGHILYIVRNWNSRRARGQDGKFTMTSLDWPKLKSSAA